MKKYHIADLLTLLRAIIGVAVFGLCILIREPINWLVLVLFSVGELTDALDGEFARRYKYPRDRKYRWWRRKVDEDLYQYELNDIYADLILGVATLTYIARWVNPLIGGFYLGVSIGIGVFTALFLESRAMNDSNYPYQASDTVEEIRRRMIIARRKCYGAAIGVVILTLILATKMHFLVKTLLILIGLFVGTCIYSLKKPTRLKEDKTPL